MIGQNVRELIIEEMHQQQEESQNLNNNSKKLIKTNYLNDIKMETDPEITFSLNNEHLENGNYCLKILSSKIHWLELMYLKNF